MKGRVFSSICSVGLFTLCTVAFAQEGGQPQKPQPGAGTAPGGEITVTGCIQREADYRQAKDAGKGGAAGTGVGAGNESGHSGGDGRGPSESGQVGTSGAAAAAYELTGSGEGQAAQFVGKRVEIIGRLKAAETSASGKPTGGATAGAPPSGVDATSKDLQLRELEVTSVKEATGACPAK